MCIFCDIIAGNIPSRRVYEDEKILAILDVAPLSAGHTLVMPKKHVANALEADPETVADCFMKAAELAGDIQKKTGAPGCNILTNCGEAAGQTVNHMHIHIIPRFPGDSAISFHHPDEEINLDHTAEILGI